MCIDVLGPSWGLFKIAHVFTSDKIGVEKFEFKNNETPKDSERKSERRDLSLLRPESRHLNTVAKIGELSGK
jgi:hypothetical protein